MHPREPVTRGGRVRASDLGSIAELEAVASRCELCRLCRDRTMVVTGQGPADADVLVVSESPGYHEDREGRLLAGRVGLMFDDLLADAGLTRADVFLTSVVKCRPPTGRTPFPDEVESCEGWLFREIALVRPSVVVTLGQLALRLVTGRQERLREVHGAMLHANLQGRDLAVWPLYHPAAALHVPTLVDELRADARGLGALLRGARADASTNALVNSNARSAEDAGAPVPVPAAPVAPSPPVDEPEPGEPQLTFDV